MVPDVLVLAAFEPELAPLRVALGGAPMAVVQGRTVALKTTGIGLSAAAAGASAHAAEVGLRAVLFVGTCGAYAGTSLAIGDVVVARAVRLVDPTVIAGASQFPEAMGTAVAVSPGILQAFVGPGVRPVVVGTTLAITVDDANADRIARAGAEVEHLEAHGVAEACALRGLPFGAVLGVANLVGARGRAEWRAHHRAAEEAAAAEVLRWLERGAPGAPTPP
jgi:nucleoside phosphorylase